ncbi:MAG: phospho-sugar mutase, partial [Microbacteriaceae bacterium]|nr:phospho-sugar mutase [Microbacteriaceae bacterium]
DGEIASEIKQAADTPVSEYTRSRDYTRAGNEIVEKYVAATAPAGLMRPGITPAARPPRIIYTAMHGTGGDITEQVFAAAKLPRLLRVASQFEPDGDFPTVEFPNPEETGALDAALQVARELNADAIIAHDPDADRLAVAVPHKHSDKTGDWRILTGNEIGLLLGWRAAARAKCRAQHPSEHPSNESSTVQDTPPALACTIVSSPALRTVAEHYELAFYETLSGFKWVGRVPGLIFGFEEALGYLVDPAKIGDKDGISAAATIAAIINELHAEERTLLDKLDDASEKFGHFASRQITVRLDTGEQVAALADRLRTSPVDFIGGLAVRKYTDLLEDSNFTVPANVLRYDLAGGARLMIRPSGTEPKLKIYLDVHAASGSLAERKTAAAALLDQLETGARNLLQHAH